MARPTASRRVRHLMIPTEKNKKLGQPTTMGSASDLGRVETLGWGQWTLRASTIAGAGKRP
jgi:hypothetical protein